MISIWEKESFLGDQDVTIIGSGFTGLWTAFHLKRKKPDLKISVLERGWLPAGASTRNAGFACFGSLSELIADGRGQGQDKMLELVEFRYQGLALVQKYVGKECGFELCGGYELYDSNSNTDIKALEHDIKYINSLLRSITQKKETFGLVDEKIDEFRFGKTSHLVFNALEGSLHSGNLLKALLRKVEGLGVQIFANTAVRGFERSGEHIRIYTDHAELNCKRLIICTNAFAKELIDEDVVPARGQVLLTSPIENLPWKGTFHADQGFYYFRNLGNRVLLGGARNKAFEDEATSDVAISPVIQNELEKYLTENILPAYTGQYSIEMRWAGIMGMGSEKMPIVKEVQPQVFCGVRMSGMGVALAPVVGKRLAKMVAGSL